ncbi:hypothetical protein D9M72_283450 [compost metagenome]
MDLCKDRAKGVHCVLLPLLAGLGAGPRFDRVATCAGDRRGHGFALRRIGAALQPAVGNLHVFRRHARQRRGRVRHGLPDQLLARGRGRLLHGRRDAGDRLRAPRHRGLGEGRVAQFKAHALGRQPQCVGCDLRHDRIGARAEVLRAGAYQRGAVRQQAHHGACARTVGGIGRGGHAQAHQLAVGVHRTRFGVAARPVEALGGIPIAFTQRFTGERQLLLRVGIGVVAQAQRDRVDAELFRQLVQRAFQRKAASSFSRRPHESRGADVQLDQPLAGLLVGAGIEPARDQRRGFKPVFDHRGAGSHIVADCAQRAVLCRGSDQVLLSQGPRAYGAEHLRPVHYQLHRAARLPRRHRGQHHVRPYRALAAEAAAYVWADHANFLHGNAERGRCDLADAGDVLRRVVQRQLAAVPDGDGRVRLHRVVVFHRRGVDRIDHGGGAAQAGVRVAAMAVGRSVLVLVGFACLCAGLRKVQHGVGAPVLHRQAAGGVARLLQSVGHDHGDGLVVVVDGGVLQQVHDVPGRGNVRGGLAALGQVRCIEGCHHQPHARHALTGGGVHRRDLAAGDGAGHHHRMGQALQRMVGGIAGAAGDLWDAVDTVEGGAGHAHAEAPCGRLATCSARSTARCASPTLKALWA